MSPAPSPSSGPTKASLEALRLESDKRQVRVMCAVMIIPTVGMVTSDIYVIGSDWEALGPAIWYRIACLLFLVLAIIRVPQIPDRRTFNRDMFILAMASVSAMLIVQLMRPPGNLVILRFQLMVVVAIYAAMPNRPILQAIPAVTLATAATVLLYLRPGNTLFIERLVVAETFSIALAIGWYVSRRRLRLQQSEERAWENEIAAREKLEHTLAELRVLRGVLPICSHCRKIRTEIGDWQQLELYVREHSEADFSHGFCPDCITEHYPSMAGQLASRAEPG